MEWVCHIITFWCYSLLKNRIDTITTTYNLLELALCTEYYVPFTISSVSLLKQLLHLPQILHTAHQQYPPLFHTLLWILFLLLLVVVVVACERWHEKVRKCEIAQLDTATETKAPVFELLPNSWAGAERLFTVINFRNPSYSESYIGSTTI